jgi:hypothetical protein
MSSDSEGPAGGKTSGAAGGGPVLLATVYDPVEAEIIVSKLRSAGIAAFLRHEAASIVYGLTVDGLGQQDIMVRAEELEEARIALEIAEDPDDEE